MKKSSANLMRFNITLSPDSSAEMVRLQSRLDAISLSEVIRRSLHMMAEIVDSQDSGYEVTLTKGKVTRKIKIIG